MSKRVLVKYISLFLVLSSLSIFFINYNKNSLIKAQKSEVQAKAKKIVSLFKKRTEEVSKFFYFNYIGSNKQLQKVLKSKEENKEKYKKIESLFSEKFTFFNKYNFQELNFYSLEGEVLYESSKDYYESSLNSKHKELIKQIAKSFEPKILFSINNTSASLFYLKTIFDENFKPLGVYEVVMDLTKLSHQTLAHENVQVDFLFDRKYLKENIDEKNFENFSLHYLSSNYMFKNSFYSNRYLDKKIPFTLFEKLHQNMKIKKDFALDYVINDRYYIASFTSLNEYTYVLSKFEWKDYENIVKRYELYTYLYVLMIFILVSLLFLINYFYTKYKLTNSKLNSISKSIDKYVIVVEADLRGIITYVSEAFCNVNGYKKEELIGRPINIIRHPDISKKFYENMWQKLKSNAVWEGEIKNVDKNGNSYWVRGNIVPIFDVNNQKIGYRSIRVNVSDEKQLQKMNTLLKRDLFIKLNEIKTKDKMSIDQSKIALMGQILDAFSNEWKKPISNLSSKVIDLENRIEKKSFDTKYLNSLPKNLSKELRILSMHLNEFKTLFTHNASDEDKYNVYTALKVAISTVPKNEATISLDGEKYLETFGVSFDLRKIILGIIYNSIEQFKKREIKDPKIDITINKANENLLIKCKDNAGGIPQEFLSRIFEADFSTKENLSSRGLPLHIAKLIVQKVDGDMWVKNEDEGCCFYIKLITKDRRESVRS